MESRSTALVNETNGTERDGTGTERTRLTNEFFRAYDLFYDSFITFRTNVVSHVMNC